MKRKPLKSNIAAGKVWMYFKNNGFYEISKKTGLSADQTLDKLKVIEKNIESFKKMCDRAKL